MNNIPLSHFCIITAKRRYIVENREEHWNSRRWTTFTTTVSRKFPKVLFYELLTSHLNNYMRSLLMGRYKVQLDVIRQLGQKIESHLQEKESKFESMSRTDASKSRSTHIKLTRDYRWVETKFKNLQLEAKQSRNRSEMQRAAELEDSNRKQFEQGINSDNKQLQMKLQDDRVTEEIMREREEEVRKINQGMHQVNEIYKVSEIIDAT